MPKIPGFVGPSAQTQSAMIAGERTVNLIPEPIPSGGKSPLALYRSPGLSTFATGPDNGRGLFAEDSGRLFAVQGKYWGEVASNGTITTVAEVPVDTNPAQLAANGDGELFVASGDRGDVVNLSSGVVTPNVVADITMCGMLDGFLVGLDAASGTMKISEADDALTWDPTQITQRSAAADPWIAMLIARRDIYLFGRSTGEVWWNRGSSPFPFAQRSGAFFEVGIEAKWSLAPFGSSLAWLGRSKRGASRVYFMNGYTPVPISTPALDWAIEQYRKAGPIDNAIGWGYEAEGHSYYVLEFPTQGKTWVYDELTSWWTERGKWEPDLLDYSVYRARFHADCFDKNLVLDSQSGKILSLSSTVYTDVGGTPLRALRRLPHVTNEHQLIGLDYLELECQRGVGLTAGQGADPQMVLRVSWDGGGTWSNERWASLGEKGDYSSPVCWDRCGRGRDLVIELSCSDPVPTYMCDLYGDFS